MSMEIMSFKTAFQSFHKVLSTISFKQSCITSFKLQLTSTVVAYYKDAWKMELPSNRQKSVNKSFITFSFWFKILLVTILCREYLISKIRFKLVTWSLRFSIFSFHLQLKNFLQMWLRNVFQCQMKLLEVNFWMQSLIQTKSICYFVILLEIMCFKNVLLSQLQNINSTTFCKL